MPKGDKRSAKGDSSPDDLNNIENGALIIKLTKSSSKSPAWLYFGALHFKEGNKIVDSKKFKWVCNVCFKEAAETHLFHK